MLFSALCGTISNYIILFFLICVHLSSLPLFLSSSLPLLFSLPSSRLRTFTYTHLLYSSLPSPPLPFPLLILVPSSRLTYIGVDILPSELPKDASDYFGTTLYPLLAPILRSKGSESPDLLPDLPPELRRYRVHRVD